MGLPYNIFDNFEEMHVNVVWDELKQRFSFNLVSWKNQFSGYLSKQPRNTHELDAFLKFGIDLINPVLNQILGREGYHPTFMNMVEYILKRYPSQKAKGGYKPTRPAMPTQGNHKV